MPAVSSSSVTHRRMVRHEPRGLSTGFMWDSRGDWEKQLRLAREYSDAAVEVSALSEDELGPLLDYLPARRGSLPFRFMSVHGPSKGREMPEPSLVELLSTLRRHCDVVVMHPDTMNDFDAYRPMGEMLSVENMDSRKASGSTVAELEAVFQALPQARFCLDVAHAWSIDSTMGEAHRLLDAFRDRLSHVHISSMSDDLHHVTLRLDDLDAFQPVLDRCIDVPWILEAPPD